MSDAVTNGLTFLVSTLTGDTTFMSLVTGVFTDIAPKGTKPDYCIIAVQSPNDVLTATATRIMSRILYQVKIVGPATDYSNISAAYARADSLLALVNNASGILCCFRQNPIYLPEPQLVDGKQWINLGGLYRVEL